MTNVLCIYHGGCDDGFGAAYAVWKALGDGVEFHAGAYGEPPPEVAGRHVLLVDFSYKRPVLEAMAEVAASILILDHHKTAAEDLAGLPSPLMGNDWAMHLADVTGWANDGTDPRLPRAVFDMERSGAMIAWEFFHGVGTAPGLIRYIQDRDLWRKTLPDIDEVIMALRSHPQDFAVWDRLKVLDLAQDGRAILRFYRAKVEEVKRQAFRLRIDGHEVPVCNAPYFLASEVAGELAEGEAFAGCFYETPHGVIFSLRSRAGGLDVSEIAKAFGGGGHRNAAGFRVGGVWTARALVSWLE